MQASGRFALSLGFALGFAAGLAGGCLNIGAYTCSDSNQCQRGQEPGYCQPTGYCSYADPVCPTGFRYGAEAGDGLADACVLPPGDTDTDPTIAGTDPGDGTATTGGSSDTEATTGPTTNATITDTDTTGSETGDTCGSLDQPCCGDSCDDGLGCYGGTCGCVATIAAGDNHTCITRADGTVMCWGANDTGQLGVPKATVSSPTPTVTAEALLGGEGLAATALDASDHTCALREDGNAVCWGENTGGGSIPGMPSVTAATPTEITLATNWVQPALGAGYTCISRGADVLATCFGVNNRGQLTGVETPGPIDIPAEFTFAEIDAATAHVCGRTATGEMYCWGDNANGQLGVNPATVPFSATVRQILVPPVGDIAIGSRHSCARVSSDVQCWGDNTIGQLGDGTAVDSLTPVVAALPDVPITDLTAHGTVTCAKLGTGEVYCWGDNAGNKLQFVGETKNDLFASVPVVLDIVDEASMPITIDQVTFGSGHACVLSETHEVFCWGLNSQGQAGTGIFTAQVLDPTRIDALCG